MRPILLALTLLIAPLAHAAAPALAADDPKVLEFARKIDREFVESKGRALDEHVDVQALAQRAVAKVAAPPDMRAGFVAGMTSNFAFGARVMESDQDVSYRLLRVRTVDGRPRALFRLLSSAGVNYHELLLERSAAGQVAIVDIHLHASGELLSQTMRRIYLQMLRLQAAQGKQALADLEQMGTQLEQMGKLVLAGKAQEALNHYDTLPASLKADKTVMLLRIRAAAAIDEGTYSEALDDYAARFKGDAAGDLMAIDGHLMHKRYDKAMEAVARVDSAIDGDPFLQQMRANISYQKGDLAASRKFSLKAIQLEPELFDAWDHLLAISLQQKDHPESARLLLEIERRFQMAFGDLANAEGYEHFIRSDAYRQWLKRPRSPEEGR